MSHFLPEIRTTVVGVMLALLLSSPLVAEGQTPIKAEEARMQIIREVPISTEVTGKLQSVNPGKEGLYVEQGDLMIEVADDLKTARVHVRQMETAHLFSGCHMTSVGGKTFHDISWSDSVLAAPAQTKAAEPHAKVVIDAEHALRTGDPALAAQILSEWMPGLRGFARGVFVRACVEATQWELLIDRLGAPQSIEELTAFVEACDHQRLIEKGLEALQSHADSVSMPVAQRLDLSRRLKIRGETSA